MKLHFLLLIMLLISCVYSERPNSGSRQSSYNQNTYGSGNRKTGGYKAAQQQILAGRYGQTSSQRKHPVTVNEVKEEKGWVDPNRSIARKYPIGNTSYQEISSLLQKQLSPNGGLTYLKASNSVLVLDFPANHAKVKGILGVVVRDAVNVRVDVEFAAVQSMSNYGIRIQHNGISVNNGGVRLPNRAQVGIRGQNAHKKTNTRQFLTTLSGSAARLWVTQTVVDRQLFQTHRFIPFSRVGGIRNVRAVAFPVPGVREVGTSLWIRPVYTDDGLVIIELFPVLTTEVNGRQQSFRVEKIQTKITARPGQRVFLGGMNKQTSQFFSSIFNPLAVGKGRVSDLVNIYVTPSLLKVGPRRR